MKVSARTEYACLAMLELAAHHGASEPIRIRQIAEQHGIPSRFLVQILLQLKGAGLVASTRGAAGGYQLAMPPDEITLSDVMAAIEGQPAPEPAASRSDRSATARVLRAAWREVSAAQHEILASLTLGELVERTRRQTQNMYYI